MSNRAILATRKGFFAVERTGGRAPRWDIMHTAFLGDNVSMVLRDPRDGTTYAALHHGHFGVKLHRSRDDGHRWEECATPVYPPQPEGSSPPPNPMGKPVPWNLEMIW